MEFISFYSFRHFFTDFTLISRRYEKKLQMNLLEDKLHVWLDSSRFVKAKPGVYVLYDKKKEVIYIGETNNLQERFTKYLEANFEGDICKQKTVAYQREFLDNPKERQSQLLEEYKNQFGKEPFCNENIRINK